MMRTGIVQEELTQKGKYTEILAINNIFLHLNSNCYAEEALLSQLPVIAFWNIWSMESNWPFHNYISQLWWIVIV